ncbi:MAG: zinc-binding dehydrogenase [Anaerolineales bacterium]|nr:zinc-binding dehydrogenase [Chloroflexota bacterium]MBL6979680.1 zinc-binding dehydrogenase [Anaerolineales bacterium]
MSYKKVLLNEFGGPEVLQVIEEFNLPEPGVGEVRVKVLAASATFSDTMVRKGIYYGFKETPPLSPGYAMVGVVDKLGAGVNGIEVGQMVADLTVFGAYTEYMLRSADSLVFVPDDVDPAEAVSMVLSYVTAYQMLHRCVKVQSGQKILVHGAGGAVGTALLELGALLNLEMYGTASKAKHELIKRLGGTPIDYNSEDFLADMQTIGGVDAAFDAIGGENFKRSFKSLKKGGTLVAYGFYNQALGKGGNVPIEYMSVALWNMLPNGRGASFYSIGALRDKQPQWFKEDLTALFGLLADGKIKPSIEQRMKLEEAARAHELIEGAMVKGRIVLIVGEK